MQIPPVEPTSPWLHPAFLLSVVGAVIGLVAWFVRLESKTNANSKELTDYKSEISEKYEAAKDWRKDFETKLLGHLMDTKSHYNEQFFNEFRQSLNEKFERMDDQLNHIDSKLDKFLSK